MKRFALSGILPFAVLLSILFSVGCKKNQTDDTVVTPKTTSEPLDVKVKQFNADANAYKGESDLATDEVNNALKDVSNFGRYSGPQRIATSPMCGVTVDTSQAANKIIYFNFDGVTPCFSPSRTRSGQIKVQLTSGSNWSNQGAELALTFVNYKVTRLSDNKSIAMNGVKKLTNINGNNWLLFLTGTQNLKYKERALNINVAFSDGSSAVWNSARTTEYNYNPTNKVVSFTANGDTTINNKTFVESWGVNRFNQSFSTNFIKPWISNNYCDFGRPISGEFNHNIANANYNFILGVDQQGNPSNQACAYGFKVTWTALNGTTNTSILSY